MFRRSLQELFSIAFMALAGSAFAQFNGHNTKGDYSMFSGTQPDPCREEYHRVRKKI
jgi:hypothetical protein